jgi:PadR family transcriptional regulator PadR
MARLRKPSAQAADVLAALRASPAGRYGIDLEHEAGLRAGSLYPILMRLADRGLLETSWKPEPQPGRRSRHLYRLTAAGQAVAAAGRPLGESPGDPSKPGSPGDGQDQSEPPTDDRARRFLVMAVTWMPSGREEWGRAMLAELDQVSGRRARWRFAEDAARAALVPPRSSSQRAAIVLVAAAAAAAATIYALAPGTGAAATIALSVVALGAWAALIRPRQAQQVSLAGRAAQVIAVALIAGCLVVALRVLVLYPVHVGGPARYGWLAAAVVFAAELAACLWPVLRRPGPLGATPRSGLLGVTAAMLTAGVLYLSQQPIGPSGTIVLETGIAAPIAAGVLATLLGAALRNPVRQLLRTGIGEWLWAVLLTGPAVFTVFATDTTARSAIIVDARHHMLTYIMMTHPYVPASVLGPIAQGALGDAAVVLSGMCVVVMMIFLLVFPPARALRYLRGLRMPPGRESEPEPRAANADWPEHQPWWPGPVNPGPGADADIISQGRRRRSIRPAAGE